MPASKKSTSLSQPGAYVPAQKKTVTSQLPALNPGACCSPPEPEPVQQVVSRNPNRRSFS